MGHSVTVGTNVNFGAFASGSIDYTFDYEPKVDEITIVVPMNQQLLRYAN